MLKIKSFLPAPIILITVIGSFLVNISAGQQGEQFPKDSRPSGVALTQHTVNVDITNQIAQVEVKQIFTNNTANTLQGIYYFPVPKGASVSDFKMIADGKVMSGEILEKDEARKIYEDIVRRQLDPALLEYSDYDLFRVRIFPIPPGKDREIILHYTSLLPQDNGLIQFDYPAGGTISSGSFTHTQKSDQRISPDITINITTKAPLKNIYSPTHKIDQTNRGSRSAHLTVRDNESSSKNFLLYFSSSVKEFGIDLLTHRPDKDEPGYFMLFVTPNKEFSKKDIVKKNVIFILDKSGSMEGEKIIQAKDAMKYCLNKLNNNDQFNIITFSTNHETFRPHMSAASDNRRAALSYVDRIEAGGGTNIHDALQAALKMKHQPGRPVTIVLLTDGLPTSGIRDAAEIVEMTVSANHSAAKIFTFGVGYDVNTFLLDKISLTSKGVSDYIEPAESIEEKITAFYNKMQFPVLTNLDIALSQMAVHDLYPNQLPDLYSGEQITLIGRYNRDGRTKITVTGTVNNKRKRIFQAAATAENNFENEFIPHLWAARKIGFLTDEIRLYGEDEELKTEIITLGKRYGIMSMYTSYLVQEDMDLAGSSRTRPGMKPVFHINAPGAKTAAPVKGKYQLAEQQAASGAGAVQFSKDTRSLKESAAVQSTDQVKHIGSRTFINNNGVWTESIYNGEKVIRIKYGSDAYRELVITYFKTAKVTALGNAIIFKLKDTFIEFADSGITSFKKGELKSLLK